MIFDGGESLHYFFKEGESDGKGKKVRKAADLYQRIGT